MAKNHKHSAEKAGTKTTGEKTMSEENTSGSNAGNDGTTAQAPTGEDTTATSAGATDADGATNETTDAQGEQTTGDQGASTTDVTGDRSGTDTGAANPEVTAAPEAATAQPEEVKENPRKDWSIGLRVAFERLDAYLENMAPNRPTSKSEIATSQVRLVTIMNNILDLEGDDFVIGMRELIATVRKYRNAQFGEMYIRRGFSDLSGGVAVRQKLDAFINLLHTAADNENPRAIGSKIDMKVLGARLNNDKQAARVTSYFNG